MHHDPKKGDQHNKHDDHKRGWAGGNEGYPVFDYSRFFWRKQLF